MAKKPDNSFDYGAAVKKLKKEGPSSLYLLYGEEDYLRELYLDELRKAVLPNGDDGFSYRVIKAEEPDVNDIIAAVDTMPFMNDRTMLELKGMDINSYPDSETLIKCFKALPEYICIVIILDKEKMPDKRLKLSKCIHENGEVINFTKQSAQLLVSWIAKRFSAYGKSISPELAQSLIFLSGDSMSGLIPEIDKIAAFSGSNTITLKDINEAAHHIPEADVFNMIEKLSNGEIDGASKMLQELLSAKAEPIMINSLLAAQFRRMYAASIAAKNKKGASYLMSIGIAKLDFIANKLISSAARLSVSSLEKLVNICADSDYMMKSTGDDAEEILVKTFALIANEFIAAKAIRK